MWCKNENKYSQIDSGTEINNSLPVGVYQLNYDLKFDNFYLTKIANRFEFNYKVYGIENAFIDKVLNTYKNTVCDIGILLYGLKGTGKTVTAKIIANKLEKPCILVNEFHYGMNEFLSSIKDDCIIFFDEFEKEFCNKDDEHGAISLLSLMDGAYTNGGRKIYLLTCNELNIEQSLLGRPSRVRYLKKFGNLTLDVVIEYLTDHLNDKSLVNDVIGLLNKLAIVTIDIIKCIVDEININGYSVDILDDINVEKQEYHYKVEYMDCFESYSINDFRETLKNVNKLPLAERYSSNLRSEILSLKKPIEEIEINEKFEFGYFDMKVINRLTEDNLLYYLDENNRFRCMHIIEGGKHQPFFINAKI